MTEDSIVNPGLTRKFNPRVRKFVKSGFEKNVFEYTCDFYRCIAILNLND